MQLGGRVALGSDPSTGKVKIRQGLLACEYDVSLVTTFLHTAFPLNYFSIIAQDSMHISDFWSILCPLIIETVIRQCLMVYKLCFKGKFSSTESLWSLGYHVKNLSSFCSELFESNFHRLSHFHHFLFSMSNQYCLKERLICLLFYSTGETFPSQT